MINENNAKRFCCEDISLIENYEAAVNDTTQTWDIHHRSEILPCGIFSVQNLIDNGLYWHMPAAQLIFLTHTEHIRLHGMNQSDETREKIGKSVSKKRKGVPLSEEHKRKLSVSHIGHKASEETRAKMSAARIGMKWWNNGQINVRARECPLGFVPGRLRKGEE